MHIIYVEPAGGSSNHKLEEKCGISATSLEPFIYDTTSADQP
jgi:hypothetical protein